MIPKIKNSFEIGSGYSQDTGFRAKIIWRKPCINSRGHSFENNVSLSVLEQWIDINYKIPVLHNPLEEYYLLQGGYRYENIYDLQSEIFTVNIARYWNYINYWQKMIDMHWYINHYIQKKDLSSKSIMLFCPGISMNRIQQYGEIMPYKGNSQRYSMNISIDCWKSNVSFIILQAQNVWIRTFFEKHRFLLRSNLSWMEINNVTYMTSTFRFFNKHHSIRGYEYRYLSLYDYLKYAKLIIGTVEYQYNVIKKCWGVIFIDFGEISNYIALRNIKFSIGFGIRWQLPMGLIKLDIAIPLMHTIKMNYKFLNFYVNLGPEL